MGVRLEVNREVFRSLQINSQGDRAIFVEAIKRGTLKLTFDSIDDEKNVGSKIWKIK